MEALASKKSLTNTSNKLSLLLPQHNKVLNELIKHATPDQLAVLNDKRDLKSLLGTLFTHKIDTTKSDALLLSMLKNSPAFKNMGNFTESLKSLIVDLKSNPSIEYNTNKLLHTTTPIQSDTLGQKNIAILESTHSTINLQGASSTFELDTSILKDKIINSGIFMESKIATLEGATPQIVEERMGNDVKSQLLKLYKELEASPSLENSQLQLKIDELLTHIDYHQLLSHLGNSNSLYFPFAWDTIEKGSLEFKKKNGEKSYCEINLTLKEHGDVDLFMALRDDNVLDIKIHTQTKQFKQLLETHMSELRASLKDANLTLRSVRIVDETQRLTQSVKVYESTEDDTYDGFEVTI